jgi:carbamoyltransferase
MNILGISAGFHDAAVSLVNTNGDILFAGHSERYTKHKNDSNLCQALIDDATIYGDFDHIAYYERPWLKQLRRLYSGEGVQWDQLTVQSLLQKQLGTRYAGVTTSTHSHHLSHAAAGFQTSTFDHATVVVIDAIGEFDTASIWAAKYVNGRAQYRRLWGQRYPHSIGLFYTAITERIGLRPMEDEYVTMGMAAYGQRPTGDLLKSRYVADEFNVIFKQNLHAGVGRDFDYIGNEDLAAGAQSLAEQLIYNIMVRARMLGHSTNLVYMGGVALNCSANRNLGEYFDDIWIMPNPGDAGSSLGAAALAYGGRLNWRDAFLGHLVPGPYPVNDILDQLLTNQIVGVASGRAEFGPRAFGNRSLLADPRGNTIKDKVNEIKRRQRFRPFAPVILEELVDEYFDMPRGWNNSRYMQTIATCRRPDLFPAIVHYDGSSRVQTVPRDDSGIRELLEKWYVVTGCPMLLNTSLNIRGEPMINDRADADRFEQTYGVRVCS